MDSRKRVFSWGFGGYGRLGHADTKDEMVPRMLQFFSTTGRGVKSVHCGSSYSLAVNEHGEWISWRRRRVLTLIFSIRLEARD